MEAVIEATIPNLLYTCYTYAAFANEPVGRMAVADIGSSFPEQFSCPCLPVGARGNCIPIMVRGLLARGTLTNYETAINLAGAVIIYRVPGDRVITCER